jgi:hypothetical protein
VFFEGSLIDTQLTLLVLVVLSSIEAEYMRAYNLGTMICCLQDLMYKFEALGTPKYNEEEGMTKIPLTVLLIDNQSTIKISKN